MTTPWSYETNPLPYAQGLSGLVDCPTDNSTLMLSCLQNRSAEEILVAYMEFAYNSVVPQSYFMTVIDGTGGILPDEPVNIISSGQYNKVPYLTGLTENDGLIFYLETVSIAGVVFDRNYVMNNLSDLVGNWTFYTGDELTQVTSLVYDYYFSDINLDDMIAIGNGVQQFITDVRYNFGEFLLLSRLPKGNDQPPAYFYIFSYQGEYDPVPVTTTHGAEIPYIFDVALFRRGELNAQDNVTSERILTLWTTFAKTGNPNPTSSDVISVIWDAVTSSDTIPYLNIDSELSMETDFRWERMQFWNDTILPVVNSLSENSKR
jgi:carboxylesterase type B